VNSGRLVLPDIKTDLPAGRWKKSARDFILTGGVLGQRPISQGKQSLFVVAKNSGYPDYILRPLSALLLEPIKAEREARSTTQDYWRFRVAVLNNSRSLIGKFSNIDNPAYKSFAGYFVVIGLGLHFWSMRTLRNWWGQRQARTIGTTISNGVTDVQSLSLTHQFRSVRHALQKCSPIQFYNKYPGKNFFSAGISQNIAKFTNKRSTVV